MMTQWIRVIHSDNGTLTDLSLASQNDTETLSLPLVAGQDYLYIGQHFPFNNVYFDIGTANSNASVIQLDIWDSENWIPAVDYLDATSVSGVPWARPGVLEFSPDRDEGWDWTDDTSEENGPQGLQSLQIYNLYWARFRVTADLSAGTVINRIGYRFASNEQLSAIDPDIDQYLTSWETGKTNWNEQLRIASDHVIADMKARGIVIHPGQILRLSEISLATAYKTLSLIYTILGPDFEFRRQSAMDRYSELMDIKRFTIDKSVNGVEDPGEVVNSPVGQMVR